LKDYLIINKRLGEETRINYVIDKSLYYGSGTERSVYGGYMLDNKKEIAVAVSKNDKGGNYIEELLILY
jgi:hypothetical protein